MQSAWCSRFCHPAPGTRDLQAQGVQPCCSVHILLQAKAEDRNHFSAHLLEASILDGGGRRSQVSPLLHDLHDARFPATIITVHVHRCME